MARVAALFREQPWLGLLCPPQASTSFYYTRYGLYQFDWAEVLGRLQPRLGLSAPVSRAVEPLRPADGFCWLRTAALRHLLDQAEAALALLRAELPDSYTRQLGQECLLSTCAQSAGFSSGWVMDEGSARAEAVNLGWYLRGLNRAMFPHCDYHDYVEVRERLSRSGGVTERASRRPEQAQGNPRDDLYSRVRRLRERRRPRR